MAYNDLDSPAVAEAEAKIANDVKFMDENNPHCDDCGATIYTGATCLHINGEYYCDDCMTFYITEYGV